MYFSLLQSPSLHFLFYITSFSCIHKYSKCHCKNVILSMTVCSRLILQPSFYILNISSLSLKYLSTISSKQFPLRWFSNNDVCMCLKLASKKYLKRERECECDKILIIHESKKRIYGDFLYYSYYLYTNLKFVRKKKN